MSSPSPKYITSKHQTHLPDPINQLYSEQILSPSSRLHPNIKLTFQIH